eukprot:maker-scaffold95_size379157-snap-gene-2.39 protein:Tk00606 transcript:maker-scaffold95_size379157-snap-gene-2.39-mRNA-1 annotation:"zinc finger protein c3h1 type-like 2"
MEVRTEKIVRPVATSGPGWYLELKEDLKAFGERNSVTKEFFDYCLAAFAEPKSPPVIGSTSSTSSSSRRNHSAFTLRDLPKTTPVTSTQTGLDQELEAFWAKRDKVNDLSPIKKGSNILGLSDVTLASLEEEESPFEYTKFDLSLELMSKSTPDVLNRRCDDSNSMSSKPESVYNKTILCKYFLKGFCIHEARCSFAHGLSELKLTDRDKLNKNHSKFKAEPCRNVYDSKFCQFGPKCIFAHNISELQNPENFKKQPCKYFVRRKDCHLGDNCFYSHVRLT